MPRGSVPVSALPLIVMLAAACAGKTQPSSTPIPAPLAAALIDGERGIATETPDPLHFAVAAVPAGYPAALVPSAPASVVGGMATPNEVVVIFTDSTRRLAAEMERLFDQAGYKRPPESRGSGFSSGYGPYSVLCRDSTVIGAVPLAGEQQNAVRVTYRIYKGRSACALYTHEPIHGILELPPLTAPAGVSVPRSGGGSGGRGGSGEVNSYAEMTGKALVPATLLAHYTAQLVAAGWTAAAPAVSDKVAAQYLEAKDPTGATWEGVLLVTGGPTAMSLSLEMHARGKP